MSIRPDRRTFFRAALAAGAARDGGRLPGLSAIEPIKRTGKPNLKLSLAAYSYNRYLDLKGKTEADDDARGLHRPRRPSSNSPPSS